MKLICTTLLLVGLAAQAQQSQPQVRVNVLNVCTPNDADQKEIAAALARVPQRPAFAPDFEIARGRSTAVDGAASRWVRIRREFGPQSPMLNAQYSFSVDAAPADNTETLVLRLREAKNLMQVSIESHAPGDWKGAITGDQDAGRVRLERFGKPSIALARCEGVNQAAYTPLFRAASTLLRNYRMNMNAIATVLGEMGKLSPPAAKKK